MVSLRVALSLTLVASAALLATGCASNAGVDGGEAGNNGVGGNTSSESKAPSDSLLNGTWRAAEPQTARLTLENGAVTGNDGCNGLTGQYTEEDGQIRFQLDPMTRKACVGVTISFSKLATATVEDDTLTLYNGNSEVITTLSRA